MQTHLLLDAENFQISGGTGETVSFSVEPSFCIWQMMILVYLMNIVYFPIEATYEYTCFDGCVSLDRPKGDM